MAANASYALELPHFVEVGQVVGEQARTVGYKRERQALTMH
jgi:hypothetical protein